MCLSELARHHPNTDCDLKSLIICHLTDLSQLRRLQETQSESSRQGTNRSFIVSESCLNTEA